MNGLIAVDGGGTKTEFMLSSTDGEVLAIKKYKGTNLNSFGFEDAFKTLEQGLSDFNKLAKSNDINIAGAYFGLAGGVNGQNQKVVYEYFKNKYFQNIAFSNAGDDLNAINVGIKNSPSGIAVIAGTGSNCMVKKDGVVYANPKLAGWGYLFDNGASGFDFGRDAIIAAKNEYNGTGRQTQITSMLEKKLNSSVFDALKDIYGKGPNFIASLCPIVFDAYKNGDDVAREIIDNQVLNVAKMINNAHYIIGKDTAGKVGLVGGIFSHEPKLFLDKLESVVDKNLILEVPQESQIYGALMESAKNAGVLTNSNFLNKYHESVESPTLQSEISYGK